MKQFEFLEHTADEKFRAYGKNLEEAFINSALATSKIMTEDNIKPEIEKTIQVEAINKERLLYEFLEEIIYLVDTEAFILSQITKLTITEKNNQFILKAIIKGDNADKYEIKTHIKAVTYNDMFIKEDKNLITIQVVHDI
ncbi:MAG: archease [Nanoarchaeota archaeon]|nr:archease [Nanoarchaeota archaeon]